MPFGYPDTNAGNPHPSEVSGWELQGHLVSVGRASSGRASSAGTPPATLDSSHDRCPTGARPSPSTSCSWVSVMASLPHTMQGRPMPRRQRRDTTSEEKATLGQPLPDSLAKLFVCVTATAGMLFRPCRRRRSARRTKESHPTLHSVLGCMWSKRTQRVCRHQAERQGLPHLQRARRSGQITAGNICPVKDSDILMSCPQLTGPSAVPTASINAGIAMGLLSTTSAVWLSCICGAQIAHPASAPPSAASDSPT